MLALYIKLRVGKAQICKSLLLFHKIQILYYLLKLSWKLNSEKYLKIFLKWKDICKNFKPN